MHADSIAVFIVCVFTWNVSHTPSSRMSAIVPLMPSTPKNTFPLLCSAYPSLPSRTPTRSLVITRIVSAPQFWHSVRGMTSSASPTAAKGSASSPLCVFASACRRHATSISVAPPPAHHHHHHHPPGSSRGSNTTLRATCMASCRFRSISFSASLLPPRSSTEHALGSSHSSMKA